MHEPDSVLENDTYTIHWNFVMQTDHRIPQESQTQLVIINGKTKENLQYKVFSIVGDHRVKIKDGKNKYKYRNLPENLKINGTWKWQEYQL